MDNHLLAFQIDKDSEQVFVHGDSAGLEFLAKQLLDLAAKARAGEFPHTHFFSEEWGGDGELSSEPQKKDEKLIHHVKVYGWPTIEGAKPYAKT